MTVLVTGCFGFIGFSVSKRLLELGHKVIGVDKVSNAVSEKAARIAILKKQPNFNFLDLDLSELGPIRAALLKLDFDYVIHLAGQYSKTYTEEVMVRYLQGNVLTWTYLMHIAHLKNIKRVVYASSTHVPSSGKPTNLYGATLAYREIAAPTFNLMGVETVAIRYSMTYGPYMREDSPPAQVLKYVRAGKIVDLNDDRYTFPYSWVYIDDAVTMTILALTAKLPESHVTLTAVADDRVQTLADCVRYIQEFGKFSVKLSGPTSDYNSFAKPQKELDEIKNILDYVPAVDAREGMRRYLEWVT